MKHTPGPWVRFLLEGKTHSVMPAMRPGDICLMGTVGTDADALLISAAPDLLSALEATMFELAKCCLALGKEPPKAFDQGLAAVQKARGE
jgi:hypothetical protein